MVTATAPQSTQARVEKPWLKMVVGAGSTVVFEATCGGHFLEFLKVSKQTSHESYIQIIKRVTASKGLAATLDGFLPWGFIQCLAKGAVFSYGQAASFKMMQGNKVISPWWTEVVSGGMGGFVQGIVMSPILLLKTRVMTDPSFRTVQGGVVGTAIASAKVGNRVIQSEGPLALMKGSTVFSIKRFADWTTRFFFVAVVEDMMRSTPNEKLGGLTQVGCALAGGTISALVTIPIDVMVATIQQASKAGSKVGVVDTLRTQLASGGFSGTMQFATRGLVARVAHVALTTLLMKTVTTKVYDSLFR